MQKNILQDYKSCSVQKTARENTKYSRNETILKIAHLAKAMANTRAKAFAKCEKPFQGRSQGRVPGVLEPLFWVMKMNSISRGKTYRSSPLEINERLSE